jgi:hypothetical protein
MAFLPGPAGPKERQKERRAIHLYLGVCALLRKGEAMKEPPAFYAVSFPLFIFYSL